MAGEFDLLPKLIPNLDRHLVFPILEFVENNGNDHSKEMKKLKFELLKETNMTDFLGELQMEIDGLNEKPAENVKKREEVLQRQQQLSEETTKLMDLMSNSDVTSNLRSDKVANLNYLKEHYEVSAEDVSLLYDYAQFLYNMGAYGEASDILFSYRFLVRGLY